MSKKFSTWGNNRTEFFYSVTPEVILDAVESCGYKATGRCLALNSLENRVYEVEVETENSSSFIIAKFYRPGRWSAEQIAEEHEFLFDLAKQEVPVVTPIKNHSGSLHKLDNIDIYFALFEKCSGRNISEIQTQDLEQIGRLLARIHAIGATKQAKHRLTLDLETYGYKHLQVLEDEKLIDLNIKSQFLSVIESILHEIEDVFKNVKNQRIHGDAHIGNLLQGRDGFFWVDFDDMLNGPPVQDLWLLIPGRDQYALDQRDLLLRGYSQFHDFDYSSLRLIEPLRTLRILHFITWIGKRYEDPAFQRMFPEYGSYAYWNEQLNIMQQQREIINQNLLQDF